MREPVLDYDGALIVTGKLGCKERVVGRELEG